MRRVQVSAFHDAAPAAMSFTQAMENATARGSVCEVLGFFFFFSRVLFLGFFLGVSRVFFLGVFLGFSRVFSRLVLLILMRVVESLGVYSHCDTLGNLPL